MNKYGYQEQRVISMTNLRGLCIAENWFTKGGNEEYSKLLNYSRKVNITTDCIVEMAEMILEHSDTEREFTEICQLIAKECNNWFAEVAR